MRSGDGESAQRSLTDLCAGWVGQFRPVHAEPDPLQVEVATSTLIGAWALGSVGPNLDDLMAKELIAYAGRQSSRGALALLRSMQVVALTGGQRLAAGRAAEVVADRGVPEPSWSSTIGRVTVGECWLMADVPDHETMLLCCFDYPNARHGLIVVIDPELMRIEDSLITDRCETVLQEMRIRTKGGRLEVIPPKQAWGTIEAAQEPADSWDPDENHDFTKYRALMLARWRALQPST